MADEHIGFLVAGMRLDDTQYRAEVKAAIDYGKNAVRAMPQNRDVFGRFMSGKYRLLEAMGEDAKFATKHTKELDRALRFPGAIESVRGLHGALFLLTGETGFFAVEALRAVNHVSKLTSTAGGLRAGLSAAGVSAVSFISKINPIVLAIAALTAAYFLLRGGSEKAEAKNKEFAASLKAIRDEADKLILSEAELRSAREKAVREKLPFGGAMPGGQVNPQILEYKQAEDRLEGAKRGSEFAKAAAEARKERAAARRQAMIDAGLSTPSSFLGDPATRLLAQFKERADAMRALAGEGNSGFGIGSVSASAFRFGPGAMGSVIGQQAEQAKTNDKLDRINQTIKDGLRNLLQRLDTDPTLGGTGSIGFLPAL